MPRARRSGRDPRQDEGLRDARSAPGGRQGARTEGDGGAHHLAESPSARSGRQTEARAEGTVRPEVEAAPDTPRQPTLTVGGLPGTGTTTLCRLLERALELPYIYAGQLFREQAAHRGMTLAEFNALAQREPEVDRALDERQLELLRGGGVILEGRLSGWLAHRHGVPAFKTWLICGEEERIRRLVERDGEDPQTQARLMQDRVTREQDRYGRYYGADLADLSVYDLVLDSTSMPPDELRERVLQALGGVDRA